MNDPDEQRAIAIIALTEAIKPMLGGRGPQVQCAVLATLTSLWLSGFRSRTERAEVHRVFNTMVEDLLSIELSFRGDSDDTQH
jgi:hypothetical protein